MMSMVPDSPCGHCRLRFRASPAAFSGFSMLSGRDGIGKLRKNDPIFVLSGGSQVEEDYGIQGYEENLFLHKIPDELNPTYLTVPPLLKAFLFSVAFTLVLFRSGLTTEVMMKSKRLLIKNILNLMITSILSAATTSMIIQDFFLGPSRVSLSHVTKKHWLPSPLSKLSVLKPLLLLTQENTESDLNTITLDPLNVHYLQYQKASKDIQDQPYIQSTNKNQNPISALYFNHGFGASSLSWIPSLPILVDRLNAKVGISHDAPGLGFTERPNPICKSTSTNNVDLNPYSFSNSACIGNALLRKVMKQMQNMNKDKLNEPDNSILANKNVGLLGHSMGSITTLKMALQMPLSTRKTIILVAPAVLYSNSTSKQTKNSPKNKGSWSLTRNIFDKTQKNFVCQMIAKTVNQLLIKPAYAVLCQIMRVLIDYPFQYFLRRLASNEKFWKKGLESVWENPNLVTDMTVLKYRWPSILKGWERGLVFFCKAQMLSFLPKKSLSETLPLKDNPLDLLKDVLELPNTSVTIIHGTEDKVIPIRNSQLLADEFPKIRFVKVDGQGHNPFEEKVNEFVDTVEEIFDVGNEDGT